MPDFQWNPRTFSYYTASGERVPRAQVREWIHQTAAPVKERLREITREFRQGPLTNQRVADWELAMRQEVKSMHVAMAAIGYGGREQMGVRELGRTGARIRGEYGYLSSMVRDAEDGTVPLDGRLDARAEMYGNAAYGTYEQSYRAMMLDAGAAEEFNVITSSNSCQGCLAAEAEGWVPVGTLPDIGSRNCLSNDVCHFKYRGGELQGES